MELESISLVNLKCFGTANDEISLRPVTILTGKNNAGKSTILHALDLLFNRRQLKRESLEFRQLFRDANIGTPIYASLKARFSEEELKKIFSASHSHGPANHWHHVGALLVNRPLSLRVALSSWVSSNAAGIPVEVEGDASFKAKTIGIKRFVDQVLADHGYALLSIARESTSAVYVPAVRKIAPNAANGGILDQTGENLAAVAHHHLTTEGLDHEIIEKEVRDWLLRLFPSLGSDLKIRTKMSATAFPQIYLEKDGKSLPLASYGSGISSVMVIIANLVFLQRAAQHNLLVLLEEPENSLHPELQRKLLTFLREQFKDRSKIVVFTTHSPSLLFAGKDVILNRVWETSQGSRVQPLTQERHSEALLDLGFFNNHLFQADVMVVVEGWSETLAVRQLLKKMGVDPDEHNVSIIPGGGTNLKFLRPEIVQKINRNTVLFLDSDRLNETDEKNPASWKNELVAEFAKNGLTCVMSSEFRELENMLPLAAMQRHFKNPHLSVGPFDDVKAKLPHFDKFEDNAAIIECATAAELEAVKPFSDLVAAVKRHLPPRN